MLRIRAYIDGYNLYHALLRLGQPHLKWLDLRALVSRFVPTKSAQLIGVHYFSAFAHWLPGPMARHKAYVAALSATGVDVNIASFKDKDRKCPVCRQMYKAHEEKETDVHLALCILDHAYRDMYDRALIVSRDSDIVPAVRMTKSAFPKKEFFVVAPPHLGHSNDMLRIVDGKHKIQLRQVEACLLPAVVRLKDGSVVKRPTEYDPPI